MKTWSVIHQTGWDYFFNMVNKTMTTKIAHLSLKTKLTAKCTVCKCKLIAWPRIRCHLPVLVILVGAHDSHPILMASMKHTDSLMLRSQQKRCKFFTRVDPIKSQCTDMNGCDCRKCSPAARMTRIGRSGKFALTWNILSLAEKLRKPISVEMLRPSSLTLCRWWS